MKRLKKWQKVTIIVFALLDCAVFGLAFAVVVIPMVNTTASIPSSLPSSAPVPTNTARPAIAPTRITSDPDKIFILAAQECFSSQAMQDEGTIFGNFENAYRNGTLCTTWIARADPVVKSASKCLYELPKPTNGDLAQAWKYMTGAAVGDATAMNLLKDYCNTGSRNSLESAAQLVGASTQGLQEGLVYLKRYKDTH